MGRLRRFKADIINHIVEANRIVTMVELGCGDGHQLELFSVAEYVGIDVSPTVVEHCRDKFFDTPGWSFRTVDDGPLPAGEMVLSMDVLLHLVEDDVFERYMHTLFAMASRLVVIYSTDHDEAGGMWPHNRHRRFTPWVEAYVDGWKLDEVIPGPWPFDKLRPDDTSDASFFVYRPA